MYLRFSTNNKFPLYAALVIAVTFYLINFIGVIYPPLEEVTAKIVNRDLIGDAGERHIEWIEAVLWLAAFIVYVTLFIGSFKSNEHGWVKIWLLFLTLLCFVALGEETSWGQHVFGFESSELFVDINKQEETNLHNLNFSRILGLNRDHILYPFLQNLSKLLNPLFYLVCFIIWFIGPSLQARNKLTRYRFLADLPSPELGTQIFCVVNVIAYLVIDKLFFDVAENFELSWSLVAILSALDVLRASKPNNLPAHLPVSRPDPV